MIFIEGPVRLALRLAPALLLVTFAVRPAHAQRSAADIESARRAYNEGLELREKGDLPAALEKFKAAHALGNTPITGTELCKTHAALRQPVEAREICLGVGRLPQGASESVNAQNARADAARIAEEMKAKISVVRIRLIGVPPGREPVVTVDGFSIPAAAIGEARALDPGPHTVLAHVGKGSDTRAIFETREGETRDVDIAIAPPPPDEVAPPPSGDTKPPPEPKSGLSPFATGAFITAGIAGGVGAIAGIAAITGKSDLKDKCVNDICGRDDHDALDRARTWGNVSTGFFIFAGVSLTAGLIAVATAPSKTAARRPSITPVLGLGGAGVHGTF